MARIAKDQLWRGSRITNYLSRLGHFRGRDIHSPFIYSIVRNVFIQNRLHSKAATIFEQLITINIDRSVAIEIANIAHHCNISRIAIDRNDNSAGMIICSPRSSAQEVEAIANSAAAIGTAVVILSPYKRKELCNMLLKRECSTSIDRFSYLVFLNNHLPKQHFKL